MGKLGFSRSPAASFVIHPEKPFVFVSFDHVVRPALPPRNSDSDVPWLRIRNNSRAPIQVLATAPVIVVQFFSSLSSCFLPAAVMA
jgi:hypothetical protein